MKNYIFLFLVIFLFACVGCHDNNSVLQPGITTGAIAGKVTNPNGVPVKNANVYTQPPTSSVTSDSSGNYTIRSVDPNSYLVIATKADSGGSRPITIRAGEVTIADIPLGSNNHIPKAPKNANPPDNSKNLPLAVTLIWSDTDPDGDPLTYDIYFDTTNFPTTLRSSDQTDTTFFISTLDTSRTYRWRIVAKDSHNGVIGGPVWNFKTRASSSAGAVDSGLVAYYAFNGNAVDGSGYGNNGIIHGATPTADRHGNANSAYRFNGIDNYIDIPNSSALNPSDQLTIALWVRIDSVTNNFSPIFYKGGTQREYALFLKANFAYPYFLFYSAGDGSSPHEVDEIRRDQFGPWMFVTIVVNRKDHSMAIYINGIQDASVGDSYSSFTSNNNSLMIGSSQESSSELSPFKGAIDDLRIYNRVLTSTEILFLYNQ